MTMSRLVLNLERLIKAGRQGTTLAEQRSRSAKARSVIVQDERRRIMARLRLLTVTDAHWPHVIAASDHYSLDMLNEGIQAGYRAAIRAVEQMGGGIVSDDKENVR